MSAATKVASALVEIGSSYLRMANAKVAHQRARDQQDDEAAKRAMVRANHYLSEARRLELELVKSVRDIEEARK